ncbi:MAG: STAS domain-containing protein [Leptospiraceae bacterium]|nr:STAS domain-containing protein [Leptospiraceae bacterium]
MISYSKLISESLLIQIEGDVLMENSKDYYNAVTEILKQSPKLSRLIFDFGKVQFMDSSGMGSLIKLTGEMQKLGTTIHIFNLNKNLSAVFQLSGIHSIIKVKTTQDFFKDFPEFEFYREIINA